MNSLQPHEVFRLVLARAMFKRALELCDTSYDIFNFSQGLVVLHDALDNFTGAIASHIGTLLPQESKLIVALNMIRDYEVDTNPAFVQVGRNEIVQLNTIRNNIKHQGIVPNISHAQGLILPITSFFKEYCKHYFGLEWDFVSLADLINNAEIKEELKKVEEMIEEGNYKDALDGMAIIKFRVFDEGDLRIALDSRYDFGEATEHEKKLRESQNIFPKRRRSDLTDLFGDIYDRTEFLEKNISRRALARFEEMTAEVGFKDNKTWNYVLRHSHEWGPPNWTREIAVFCHDFLVDVILRYQKTLPQLTERLWSYHTFRTRGDIKIYDKDDREIYTILKDVTVSDALIFARVAGRWEDYNKGDRFISLMETGEDGERIAGYYTPDGRDNMEFIATKYMTRRGDDWFLLAEE